MIPVRLTLQNFMSYGEEGVTLDFTGLHVACLSGDNGNGKSALLDAITYALWGKTRASGSQASAEDDLVRLGAEEAHVTLDFRLGQDLYRARRRRNRRTHSGDWQLFQQDLQGDWHPAGGAGSRDMERKITQLLRMDYETFLNSAYIQQGRADEFTRQKPDARKRILTEVLELQRYDRLEEMAKERRDAANMLLKELDGEMRHLEARISEADSWREQLAAREAEVACAGEDRERIEMAARALRDRLAVLEERAALVRRLQQHSEDLKEEIADIDRQVGSVESQIAQDRALLAERDEIEQSFERLRRARAEVESLEGAVARSVALERDRQTVIGALALRRQELIAEIASVNQEVIRLEEWERERETAERNLADILPQIAHFEAAQAEQEAARAELARIDERFTELRARNRHLAADLDEFESILALLDRPKPACPVCSTDLSGGKQAGVVAKQKSRLSQARALLEEVKREGAEVKRERETQRQRVESLEAKARAEAALRSRLMDLTRRRDEADLKIEELGDVRGQRECLRARLAAEAFGERERAELAEMERDLAGLQDAVLRREEAERTGRELAAAGVETKLARLRQAERTLVEREAELRRLTDQQARKRKQIAADRIQLSRQEADLRAFDATRAELAETEASLRMAVAVLDAARAHADRARHALEDFGRAADMLASRKTERDKVQKDSQAYADLVAAFGKKGVQAVIIESMLPEIEEEANRLLARLTDSRMQVTLTTLRQARSGSHQIETLDIQITDDAGTRPYELYSGGEAFRVNFALRIALSRLLARRSGARLQTLILDEGFGSQDAKGRERLVEAIEAVKDEFALILVISHIEELKDAFTHRIEVTKTPEGSKLAFV